jgi:hypothetical protein
MGNPLCECSHLRKCNSRNACALLDLWMVLILILISCVAGASSPSCMRALSGLIGRLAPCFPIKSRTYKAHASSPNQSSRAGSSTWLVQHRRRLSWMLTHALATRSLPLPPQGLQRAGCPSRPSCRSDQGCAIGTAFRSPNWPIHVQFQLSGTVTDGLHVASKMGKRAYMPVKARNFGAVF